MTGDVDRELTTARAELVELRNYVELLRAEQAAASELADAERALADAVTADRRLNVDDLTMRNLRGLAETWQVLNGCDVSRDGDRRLGDVVKVLPADDVNRIIGALRRGLA